MTSFHKTAAVLAALAFTVPMVSQAAVLDPFSTYKKVQELITNNKPQEAASLCDQILEKFGGNGATAQQFNYVLPLYAWQRAEAYFKSKDYAKAYDFYKEFNEDKRWKDPALQARFKEQIPAMKEGFTPYLTWSLFQMGYCRYMEGTLLEGDAAAAKFAEAIAPLEDYLALTQKGKVSATEKKQRLDGQVCFLLMQCYILKNPPDLKKASEYLDKSRQARGKVPEEMATAGLNSILAAATADPNSIGWVYKLINSNISSYKVDPSRAGRNAGKYLNYAIRSAQLANKSLKEGNMDIALDAYRSANILFGLVADTNDIINDASALLKQVGKYKGSLNDASAGTKVSGDSLRKLLESFKKVNEEKQIPEAMAILNGANVVQTFGSPRLAKAGYQIIYDRYKDLQSKDKDGSLKPLRPTVTFQLAQLNHATGDEKAADALEKQLEGQDVGGDRTKSLVFNKMRRLLKDQKWEEVINAAKEVMEAYKDDPSGKFYASAAFSIVAANYKLNNYEGIIEAATELLHGNSLVAGDGKNSLKPAEALKYQCQTYYFLLDAYLKLAAKDPKMLEKAIEVFDEYKSKITSLDLKENEYGPLMYFYAGDAYLKLAALNSDEAAAEKLQKKGLEAFKVVCDNWPQSDIYPNAELMTASVIIAGKDDSVKDTAIQALERCADAALKLEKNKGRQAAANALFWLASYTPEIAREGEDEAARATRAKGYQDRFWKEADYEGNPFALQEVALELNQIADKASFDASTQHARDIIAREATYAHTNNKTNSELEKTINGYVTAYVDGTKKYDGKELTLAEKSEHFNNFPGIAPDDKYARAIFRMAFIDSMNKALAGLKDDPAAKQQLQNDIEATFREMTATFKPDDLTDFICVSVGDYLVSYVGRFEDPSTKQTEIDTAVSYYDAVINRNKDAELVAASNLGKANALAFSKDAAKQAQAIELYNKVAATNDPTNSGPALAGLTKLYMRSGDYAKAVESATKYINNRANVRERLAVLILLGEAYDKAGDAKNALLTYMNIYNQNKGNIQYSAPACKAIMEVLWKRNTPESGDRLKGDYKHSDHWTAWDTGQKYVDLIKRSGIDAKMQPAERDEFNKVLTAVDQYAADAAVQKEDKASKDFQRRLQKK